MNERFHSIQHMRGLAAIMVVVAHAFAHPLPDAPVPTWVAGRLGVVLFFVISGFIMVIVTGPRTFDPIRFVRHRIIRIVPIYWAITLASAAAAIVIPAVFRKTIFDLPHLFGSLFFIPMLRPGNPGMIEPFVKLGWTLNYEMFFYVIFAALFFLSSERRVFAVVATLAGLTAIGQVLQPEQTQLRFYTSYDLVGFAGGVLLGLAHQKQLLDRVSLGGAAAMIAAALTVMLGLFLVSETKDPDLGRQVLSVVACMGLIGGGLAAERARRTLPGRFVHFLGDASYSIYLMHMFPVGAAAVLERALFGASPSLPQYLAIVVLGIVSGIATGGLTYLYVEQPMLAVARRYFA